MQGRTLTFANVASGDTCSSLFALGRRSDTVTFLVVPLITSCGLMQLQGSHLTNPTSADFVTMQNPYGSGAFGLIPGAGRVGIAIHDFMGGMMAGRVVFNVAQAGPTSLAIVNVF